jgi:lipoprotein-anchoring transpeptidase ErfK/SrfK
MRNPRLLLLGTSLALAAMAGACSEQKPPSPQDPLQAGPNAASKPNDPRATPLSPTSTAPGAMAGAPAAPSDAGAPAYEGPYLAATVMQAIVLSDMEWPPSDAKRASSDSKVVRLGYLRHGAKAPVIATPHKKSNCAEGWYELVAGGFVCGKYATTDLNHPKVKGSRPPDFNAITPYTYGANTTNGTPIYRQVPSREERLKLEPWLAKPKAAKKSDDGGDNPYASNDDGGAADPSAALAVPQTPVDDGKPWYMRDADGGAPQITLDELREQDGPVARRMVKGFYLSLDRMFTSNNSSWWKTNDGLVAPADRVYVAKPRSEFKGLWLDLAPTVDAAGDGGAKKSWHLPIGFITSPYAHKHSMAQNKKKVARGGALHRQTIVQLTGETVTIDGTEYFETDEGWWMRGTDGTKTEAGPAPDKLGAGEKWIDVNLKRQTLVAFEGDHAVFATIVSSGRQGHETPPGTFRVREKHVASTMDGDADTVSDGPYSIQDVPYIQYFSGSYALHGAFWHDEFGHVKSHGCVNLAPWDSRALFNWTEPQLPEGWHGVSSTHTKPGTRVVLHF